MNVEKIKISVMKKIISLLVFGLGLSVYAQAQDSVAVETKEAPTPKYARATFNSTKIINMQSTEMVSPGALQFMISHHFSNIWNKDAGKQNVAQLFGLNSGVAHTYLSFDYSFKPWLNVGVAAAGASKYEGWAKFKLLRQQTGVKNIPVSLVFYSMANVNTAEDPESEFTGNKFSFVNQLLIARKMTDKLSLELIPTWIHYNLVPYGINNSNEVFSLGLGGKYKVRSNMNITFEYSRQLNMFENLITKNGAIINYNPDLLSLGIEMNTGGHQFQFYVGSTTDASNLDQLSRNNSSIKDGNFAFGFTINRSMNLKKD
jgi:opacity protein-like surface antigen